MGTISKKETIWKCIVWNVIKWWMFLCKHLFFHLGLWEQSSGVGFEQTDVYKVYTSPSEPGGISVGSKVGFSPWAECQHLLLLFLLLLLVRSFIQFVQLSQLLWLVWDFARKILSAKLLHVIPQNFSWWQIPGDGTILSKGLRGWDQQSWIMFSALQRQIVSFGEEVATSYPLLPNYYFRRDVDPQFMKDTFPDQTETYSMFKAQRYSRLGSN